MAGQRVIAEHFFFFLINSFRGIGEKFNVSFNDIIIDFEC